MFSWCAAQIIILGLYTGVGVVKNLLVLVVICLSLAIKKNSFCTFVICLRIVNLVTSSGVGKTVWRHVRRKAELCLTFGQDSLQGFPFL